MNTTNDLDLIARIRPNHAAAEFGSDQQEALLATIMTTPTSARTPTGRTGAGRRRSYKPALAAVAVLAASGVGVGMLNAPARTDRATTGPAAVTPATSAGTAQTVTLAYVTRKYSAALADTERYIRHSKTTVEGFDQSGTTVVTDEDWRVLNGSTVRTRSIDGVNGVKDYDIAQSYPNGARTGPALVVDYQHHTWYAAQRKTVPNVELPELTPERIKQLLTQGSYRIVANTTLDGVAALELSDSSQDTLWIDANTYLPIRSIEISGNPTHPENRITQTWQWLPITPANLTNLTNNPPAGFAHTEGPPAVAETTGGRG